MDVTSAIRRSRLNVPLFLRRIATLMIGHAGRNPALLMAKMEISQGHLEVTTDWEALTT